MAAFANADLLSVIDKKWDMTLEPARYANAVIMPRIANRSAFIKKSGDTISVPIKAKYTVGNVGANGAFVPQVQSPTNVNISIDQWVQIAIETDDKARAQTFWDPDSDFPQDAAKAFAVKYDTSIASLFANLTTTIINTTATPTAFDSVPMRTAMLKLANLNIPKEDLSFVLPAEAFYLGLFSEDRFTMANTAGLPKNVLTTNYRFPLLGVPAYESVQGILPTVGTPITAIQGSLFHKSAFCIGMQMNTEYHRADRTAGLVFSYVVGAESLYGFKTIRDDHAVLINIKPT